MTAALLVLLAAETYDQTAPWKAYISRVEKAFALEIRWSKNVKLAETYIGHGSGPPSTRSFTLLVRKPDYVSFEEPNVRKFVWNGSAGIQLDYKAKVFHRLTQLPHLEEVQFLHLPRFSGLLGNGEKPTAEVISWESKGAKWSMVNFKLLAVDAGIGYEYTFADRTGLLRLAQIKHRGMTKWNGVIDYRIQTFDTDRMALTTEFSVEPPKGFKEARR